MDYLWALDASASAVDVHAAVAPELAYTTITTVLNRLVEKQRLERVLNGRSYQYSTLTTEADFRAGMMRDTFGAADDRAAVLSRFVGGLSGNDIDLLRDLLDER